MADNGLHTAKISTNQEDVLLNKDKPSGCIRQPNLYPLPAVDDTLPELRLHANARPTQFGGTLGSEPFVR